MLDSSKAIRRCMIADHRVVDGGYLITKRPDASGKLVPYSVDVGLASYTCTEEPGVVLVEYADGVTQKVDAQSLHQDIRKRLFPSG